MRMNKRTHPVAKWRKSQTPVVTQERLGQMLAVGAWTIKSIEVGRRRPSVELAQKIAGVTGLPLAELRPDLAAFLTPSKAMAQAS